MPWYSEFLFFIFSFRSNGKKEHLDKYDFRHVYGSCFKSAVLKVTWFQLFQSSFSAITRYIDSGIWKILDSWRLYGYGSTYMLILSWVNIRKLKWTKVPWKLLVAQKLEPVLWRTSHQNISFLLVLFFASQTNLVFKFSLVLIELFLLQFVYLYLWILSANQIICVNYLFFSRKTFLLCSYIP